MSALDGGAPAQQAVYRITIDGNDVSRDVDPILISLSIRMGDGDNADEL